MSVHCWLAENITEKIVGEEQSNVTIDKVQKVVCDYFNITRDDLLSKTYLLTPNEKECRLLCGETASDDVRTNAETLLAKGVKNVIVTLGEKGSILCNASGHTEVPAVKVNAVDTGAAGDTYNGALVGALSEGKTMTEAMAFATKASAIAVTRFGAQPSVPYRSEIK